MKRLFDDNLYQFDRAQPSYWEATADTDTVESAALAADASCDVAIIGGGYTGLSAALHLARDYGADVRLLEAGHVGWGASGRNGGFCCVGGTGMHRDELVSLAGLDAARAYYAAQERAVELVRSLIDEEGIDCDVLGEAEVEIAHTPRAFERLREDHALMTGPFGGDAELFNAAEARERFYDSTETYGALSGGPAFGLHPLKYCIGLAQAAVEHGARLHAHSEVLDWSRSETGKHRLETKGGTLTANRVIFATNGFMPEQLHPAFHGRAMPVISAIVVTRPLTDDEWNAQGWRSNEPTINARRLLNYFRRLPDGRFLFGGRGDVIGSPARERQTYAWLERRLREIWPAWRDVAIDYRWHGLICTTATLRPSIGRLEDDDSVFFGFGYHGNGVNTATWTGQQLAEWAGRNRQPEGLPDIVNGLSRRYPLPAFRRSFLRFALFAARQLDRFG